MVRRYLLKEEKRLISVLFAFDDDLSVLLGATPLAANLIYDL